MVLACRDASHRTPVSEFPRGIAAHVEGWSLGGGRGESLNSTSGGHMGTHVCLSSGVETEDSSGGSDRWPRTG